MEQDQKRKPSFLLRLPVSTRDQAIKIAHEEGTSLNHFISLAVAEKISRMNYEHLTALNNPRSHSPGQQPNIQPFRLSRSA